MKAVVAGLIVAAATLSPACAADSAGGAANAFYAVAHSAGSGLPNAAARARLAPLVTPHLAQLLEQAAAVQDRFTAGHKDIPPLVEGDIYSSLFEGPTAFSIGACTGDTARARCPVALTYAEKGAAPTVWTDTLYLANGGDGWKVDDIGYGGSWAFGNKGRLSDTLNQVAGFVSDGQ